MTTHKHLLVPHLHVHLLTQLKLSIHAHQQPILPYLTLHIYVHIHTHHLTHHHPHIKKNINYPLYMQHNSHFHLYQSHRDMTLIIETLTMNRIGGINISTTIMAMIQMTGETNITGHHNHSHYHLMYPTPHPHLLSQCTKLLHHRVKV